MLEMGNWRRGKDDSGMPIVYVCVPMQQNASKDNMRPACPTLVRPKRHRLVSVLVTIHRQIILVVDVMIIKNLGIPAKEKPVSHTLRPPRQATAWSLSVTNDLEG